MATVQLFKAFDFASNQDWDWEVTAASATSITIANGTYKQTVTGAFTFDPTGMPSGTVSASSFFFNNEEVYRVTDMAHDATRIAQFAETEGDTQQTYAFVFSGNDSFTGSAFADGLMGYAGNDSFSAGAGNDRINGGAGNDSINGQDGLDTAVFSGARANYTVTRTANGFTVVDKTGAEGTDTLTGVERLVFADGGVALDVDSSSLGGQAYRIYKAAFARTPDSGGVGFWMSALDKGMSLVDIATGFIASDEYKTAYGTNLSNRDLITKYYENILGRAPEQGGLDFWVGVLDNKQASVAQVLASISESGENITGTAALIANGFDFTPYG
jgi:Ca2+-binding RTX toxin-like protein